MTPSIRQFAVLTLSLLPGALVAQAPTAVVTTGSDWGVLASDGTTTNHDAQATGTTVTRFLGARAGVGGFAAGARASSMVSEWRSGGFFGPAASGVMLSENGGAQNDQATGTFSAGTSADAPGAASPTQAPHGISVAYALAQGTAATVQITWTARASTGAAVSGSVDVDGDGTADWTSTPGTNERLTIPVTAGASGVTLDITTDGSASVTGVGREGYMASLVVTLSTASTSSLTYTWANSGPACAGTLAGAETVSGFGTRLDFTVTGGVANGFGMLLMGAPAATPTPLPAGSCDLLLDGPRFASFFRTDANGGGAAVTFTRNRAMVVDFQAVTFAFASNAMGSTDLLNLTVQ